MLAELESGCLAPSPAAPVREEEVWQPQENKGADPTSLGDEVSLIIAEIILVNCIIVVGVVMCWKNSFNIVCCLVDLVERIVESNCHVLVGGMAWARVAP